MTAVANMPQLQSRRSRLGAWIAALLLLIASLALFVWAGGSWNPRLAIPWTFTATGWLVPAPGLAWLWASSAALFAFLSIIAWMLFNPIPAAVTLKPQVSAAIILLLAALARIAIALHWTPLPLDSAMLSMKILPHASAGRWLIAALDMLVLAVILLSLAGARRSLWWGLLYAVHPLVLLEITGNAHWIVAAILPLVFIAALSHRISRRWRSGLAIGGAALCVAAIMSNCWQGIAFNSLTFEGLEIFGRHPDGLLPIAAALLESAVVVLSIKHDWPLARTFGHLLILFFICAPVVNPACVVVSAALLPLAWNRAAWVLSGTVLGVYIAILGPHRHSLGVPDWWLMLEWIPIVVLEAHELGIAAFRFPRASAAASPSVP